MRYEKLAPALAVAYDDYERGGVEALVAHAELLGVVASPGLARPPRIVAFLVLAEAVDARRWEHLGVELNMEAGPVRTGIVAFDAIGELTDDPALVRLVPAERLAPLMDVAPGKVNLPRWRDETGLDGQGVVVGIVDTGIYAAHPDFSGRVLRIWDQTLSGPGVAEGAYGVELTGELLGVSRDTFGHGTHVAGIAAGAEARYRGVAPAADLVIVKTDLLTATIADGIRYVFRVAGELGRPAVVNLSLGGQADPHDGTDALSAIVDAESGPGRIVCCAAGNDGDRDIHARALVAEGPGVTVWASVPAVPGGPAAAAAITAWYPGGDELEVAVIGPSGEQTPFQGPVTGRPTTTRDLADGTVRLTTPGPDPVNGDHNVFVQLLPRPVPGAIQPDRWGLRFRAVRAPSPGSRLDLWILGPGNQFTGRHTDDAVKVGSPGAATQAVTVASYTTRTVWTDAGGDEHRSGFAIDTISDFSSEGPRRDGEPKPDVTAPGSMIISARSAHAPMAPELVIDGLHVALQGTSMACPFVTGLVALLLQRDPTLDPGGVKAALQAASVIPDTKPGTFDPQWGYGLVDASGL